LNGGGSDGGGGCSSETAAAESRPAVSEVAAEWNPPASHGGFSRISICDGSAEHSRYEHFGSHSLQRAWRTCVGVRGRKVTTARFQRLMRDSGLLDGRFSAADADLLYMQTMMRHASGQLVDDRNEMGFHEFCDALIELARRRQASEGAAESEGLLAKSLERIISSLAPSSHAPATHAPNSQPLSAASAGGGTVRPLPPGSGPPTGPPTRRHSRDSGGT